MKKLLVALVALLVAFPVLAVSAHESERDLELTIARAPVAPDGTTAGAPLDFVVSFADPDPAVDGVGLKAGATIVVRLDSAFDLTGDQGSHPGGFPPPPAVIMLQGWPQSPRVTPTPYTTEIVGNTITLTLVDDWSVGAFGPGPKALHLALLASSNPAEPGKYSVELDIKPDPASSDMLEGDGRVKIISKVKPSVNVVALFSGPPGPPPPFFNPLYQDLALGDPGRQVGMYLWERGGAAALGVDIEMKDSEHGRLVQDGQKIGKVRIEAPEGASNHILTSTGASVELPAFVTGIPTGLLITQFTPDPEVAGHYTVTFKMNGGNSQTLNYAVAGPDGSVPDDDDDSEDDDESED